MAPRGIGAGEHDQVGLVEILVIAGHGVGAEGTAMSGDGGRHAEPRIGVDIGRADKTLHQLVGDVIIFREQLARQIDGRRIRAMLG